MVNYGDITKINGRSVPIAEAVIGGSPCQDLSVAGKRAGLSGERSGLFMDQIRVTKEMREYDREVNGRTGSDIRPRYMVWENVPGAFSSNGGEDFRAVLEEIARIADENAVIPRPADGKWTTAGCIMADWGSITWRVLDAQFWGVPQRRRRIALVADFGGYTAPEILFECESVSGDPETSGTQGKGTAGGAEGGTPAAVIYLNDQGGDVMSVSEDVTGTLRAQEHGHQPAICIQGNCIDRADTAGCNGKGWRDDDVSFTLNTIDRPAVYDARGNGDGTTEPTLTGDHENRVTGYTAITYQKTTGPLMANSHPGSYTGQDAYNDMLVAKSLRANGSDPQREDHATYPITANLVRRLTPLECERLQGYPDGWTDIGEWTDSKGKKHESSDSARYKALGNSIALPPWRFVLSRMNAYLKEHTMASLFDGIGGFPLIWQELNGPGKCLWTSEIEEFPIAVTKRRFEA